MEKMMSAIDDKMHQLTSVEDVPSEKVGADYFPDCLNGFDENDQTEPMSKDTTFSSDYPTRIKEEKCDTSISATWTSEFSEIDNFSSNIENQLSSFVKKEPLDDDFDNIGNDACKVQTEDEDWKNGESKFKCQHCSKSFKSKGNLVEHVKCKHEKNLDSAQACEICGKMFHWQRSLRRHMETHKKCSNGASTPQKKFETEGKLEDDNFDLMCQYCAKTFDKPYRLREHVASMHEKKNQETCPICGKVFHWHRSFKRHMAIHEKASALEAGVEPGLVESKEDLMKFGRDYKCLKCDKIFNKAEFLKLHLKKIHNEISDDFLCKTCNKRYSCNSSFKRHMATHKERESYNCMMCDKSFLTLKSLQFHMATHTGDTKFECSKCGRKFGWNTSRRTHELNCTGVYFGQCRYCCQVFSDWELQNQHVQAEHQNNFFTCVHCKLTVANSKALKLHLTVCEAPRFDCNICDFSSTAFQDYGKHLEIHIDAAKLPQNSEVINIQVLKIRKCNICGKSFHNARQLLLHKRNFHNETKEYKCEKCDHVLFSVQTYRSHMQKCTGLVAAQRLSEADEKLILLKAETLRDMFPGTLPYVCTVCKQGFLEASVLKIHVKSHVSSEFKTNDRRHARNRYYYCEPCKRKFSTFTVYMRHKKSEIHKLEELGRRTVENQEADCMVTQDKSVSKNRDTTDLVPGNDLKTINSDILQSSFTQDDYNDQITIDTKLATVVKEEIDTSWQDASTDMGQNLDSTFDSTFNSGKEVKVVLKDVFSNVTNDQKEEYLKEGKLDLNDSKDIPIEDIDTSNTFKVEYDDDYDDGPHDTGFDDNDESDNDNDYVPKEDDNDSDVSTSSAVQKIDTRYVDTPDLNEKKIMKKQGEKTKKKKTTKKIKKVDDNSSKNTKKASFKNAFEVVGKEGDKVQVKCKECGKILQQGAFSSHYRIHLDEFPHTCPVCQKGFRTSTGLKDHINFKHNTEPQFCCEVCGVRFKDRKMRKYHERLHSGNMPYKCDQCDYATMTMSNLNAHKTKHTGVKPYQCSICGKSFRQSGGLKLHTKSVHEGYRSKASCKICGQVFNCRSTLFRHTQRIHPADGKTFSCNVCDKVFLEEAKLEKHLLTHLNPSEFQCELCHKSFKRKTALKKHIVQQHSSNHQGLPCGYCGRLMFDEDALKRHMSTHEKNKDGGKRRKSKKSKIPSDEVPTDEFSDDIMCQPMASDISNNSFNPNDNPDIYCPQCGKVFKNRTLFIRHMQEHLEQATAVKGISESESQGHHVIQPQNMLHAPAALHLQQQLLLQQQQYLQQQHSSYAQSPDYANTSHSNMYGHI